MIFLTTTGGPKALRAHKPRATYRPTKRTVPLRGSTGHNLVRLASLGTYTGRRGPSWHAFLRGPLVGNEALRRRGPSAGPP
jgi:hypothetical protein